MDIVVAYRGSRFTIEYARQANGDVPGLSFFKSIDERWQARITYLHQKLGDTGRISNQEMFRKEQGEFWAFKAFQHRFLCYFRSDRRVVITHGFSKKTDKMSPGEFGLAARTKQEYEHSLAQFSERE